jgi:uncharacterized membrane protein YjjP (DUF1212 family)
MNTESPAIDTGLLLEFMSRLGHAYLACGLPAAEVEVVLRRIASAHNIPRSQVVAFSTALFIALHDGVEERVTLAEGPVETLRLDQIADVYALGDAAQRAAATPREGLDRLADILRKTARFGSAGALVGHTILTVGVAMLFMPSLTHLASAALLGAIVGTMKMLNERRGVLAVLMPVIAATLVSVLVFWAVRRGLPVNPLHVLVPPLVTFLPGAMLTLGMVELAYGDMVSGSSRLTTGFVQLVLLAFGIAAGAALVGISLDDLLYSSAAFVEVPWVPWAGVVVFGLGLYLHFSAPRNSLLWMLLVLLLVFWAQRLGASLFGGQLSGFFGMLVAMPLSYLIQLRFKGPPAIVTFLPSFWLVVPGSLGLLSITRMLSDRAAGLADLVTAVFALASIALGTLVGVSLYKGLTEYFGWWRLQSGRVGSYVRRQSTR